MMSRWTPAPDLVSLGNEPFKCGLLGMVEDRRLPVLHRSCHGFSSSLGWDTTPRLELLALLPGPVSAFSPAASQRVLAAQFDSRIHFSVQHVHPTMRSDTTRTSINQPSTSLHCQASGSTTLHTGPLLRQVKDIVISVAPAKSAPQPLGGGPQQHRNNLG